MLIQKRADLRHSDVTPKSTFLNRRQLLAGIPAAFLARRSYAQTKWLKLKQSSFSTSEKQNTIKDATTYNNYYEFGTRKDQPALLAKDFKTNPWTLSVEGEVSVPRKYSLDELLALAPLEERIYRLRCVEGWSMVVPWAGYSLSELIRRAKPGSKAAYVAFETFYDPAQMPQAKFANLAFPYVEALRLDEALHPLTMLTVGMYGDPLLPQNGAPVRLIVPWKYGFKSAKSLVRIRLTAEQPSNSWNIRKPHEYGFYGNVNPAVDHPRWSQATERRLGEFGKRPTLPFNGYSEQVASLYSGLDLQKNY